MCKYIVAPFLSCNRIVEVVLALHGGLREALLESSPVGSERAEPPLATNANTADNSGPNTTGRRGLGRRQDL